MEDLGKKITHNRFLFVAFLEKSVKYVPFVSKPKPIERVNMRDDVLSSFVKSF